MNVLDDYMVDPRLSLLDKTKIQAQVLVPVLRALRAELGKETADALVRQALRDWSKQLFAAVGDSIQGSKRRKWAAMQAALTEITEREVTFEMKRQDKEVLEFDVTDCRFANSFARWMNQNSARCWSAPPILISSRLAAVRSA